MEKTKLMKATIEYLSMRVKELSRDLKKISEIEEQRELNKRELNSQEAMLQLLGECNHIIQLTEMELKLATPWEPMDYQEASAQVTLEMEMGKDIPLGEWARKNGLDESTARQKARRGSFNTAHKVGRDWFINEFELNPDRRKKKS